MSLVHQAVFVSATPGNVELSLSEGRIVEQLIRPTGILDPRIRVIPTAHQMTFLLDAIRKRIEVQERCLVVTLTKRMAEDLAEFLRENNVNASFLHSEIDALGRLQILKMVNAGEVDVVVGVNLLREGIDLPGISLVAILDADKEGFLRSPTALIQTIGRAARNVNGEVLMFADRETEAMRYAMEETSRRRVEQIRHNTEHSIVPTPIVREKREPQPGVRSPKTTILDEVEEMSSAMRRNTGGVADETMDDIPPRSILGIQRDLKCMSIDELQIEMDAAIATLDFEFAAQIRDTMKDRAGSAGLGS